MPNNNLVYVELPGGGTAQVGASFAKSKGLTVIDPPDKTSRKIARQENINQHIPAAVIDAGNTDEPLKGTALDEALTEAGLSTSGKVADKQARLAEHLANPQTPAVVDGGGTPDTE